MISNKKAILIIVLAFIFSIVIRIPNIFEKEASFTYQEETTLHVITTLMGFDSVDWHVHKFLPIISIGGEINKFYPASIDNNKYVIYRTLWDNEDAFVHDNTGNAYYTSFPPLTFIVPYLFIKILNIPINLFSIRLFNVFLTFCSLVFIYKIVMKLTKNNFTAILGALIYIFNANQLWHGANVYWGQLLLQPLWLASLWVFLKIIENKTSIIKLLALMFILIFMMCYTEWTAGFIVFSMILVCLYKYVKTKHQKFLVTLVTIVSSSLFSYMLLLIHFGLNMPISLYLSKIFVRSSARISHLEYVRLYLTDWSFSFLPIVIILIVIFVIKKIKPKSEITTSEPIKIFVFLSAFPMLENFVLLGHAAIYTYDILKFSVFLVALLTVLSPINYIGRKKVIFLFTIAFLFCIANYYYLHPLSLINDVRTINLKKAGEIIRSTSNNNDFVCSDASFWYAKYYITREVFYTPKLSDAIAQMKKTKFQQGKFYFTGDRIYDYYNLSSSVKPSIRCIPANLIPSIIIEFNNKGITNLVLLPADYTDKEFEKGLSRYSLVVVFHTKLPNYIQEKDVLYNDKGYRFIVNHIDGYKLYLSSPTPDKFRDSRYFKTSTISI